VKTTCDLTSTGQLTEMGRNCNEMLGSDEMAAVFEQSICFRGLEPPTRNKIAAKAISVRFAKGDTIFRANEPQCYFYIVAKGLVHVSICSFEGHRLTYLLAAVGEPLNLVSTFSNKPRMIEARAMRDAVVVLLKQSDFITFAFQHPSVISEIITVLGNAVDSANSRILDMVGKNVDQRMRRILHALYLKFGPDLRFTSIEIAEMIGTTVESSLRSLSKLRKKGLIATQRGRIGILQPEAFTETDSDMLWL
jgi:CRP-like cAMP-binding protein